MAERLKRLIRGSQWAAWALLFFTLPLTSFPLLARLSGADTIAPLAVIPLVYLILFSFIPYILIGGRLPRQTLPILGFTLVAVIASAYAFHIDIPPYSEKTLISQVIPALLTLGVGIAFFLVVTSWIQTRKRLNFTLRLINYSGLVLLGWSLIQVYVIWIQGGRYPIEIWRAQELVSVRALFPDRVTGFAYEPSYLAHQLNLLYLPYWLAATIQRSSAHKGRILGISLENILLVAGILVLLASFSRIGLLAFLLALAYLVIRGSLALTRWINPLLEKRLPGQSFSRNLAKTGTSLGVFVLLMAAFLVPALAFIYGLSRVDPRLKNLFNPVLYQTQGFFGITNYLAFAERVIYWATGWEIFNDHPFLGVGLGNAGFFFPQKMPAFGWALWETTTIFHQRPFLPNTKSMWVRTLTETGLIGLAFLITWLYLLWQSALSLWRSMDRTLKTVALAGQLALVAFLIEGFSIDSFALPYLWVSMGILAGTTSLARRNEPTVPT